MSSSSFRRLRKRNFRDYQVDNIWFPGCLSRDPSHSLVDGLNEQTFPVVLFSAVNHLLVTALSTPKGHLRWNSVAPLPPYPASKSVINYSRHDVLDIYTICHRLGSVGWDDDIWEIVQGLARKILGLPLFKDSQKRFVKALTQ